MGKNLFFFLAAFLLMGCTSVIAPTPFGLEPVQLSAEYIEGVWVDDEGHPITISVLDKEKALIEITYDESDDPSTPQMKTIPVHLMAGKKWQYASTLASEEGDVSQGYLFACMKAVPTKILIWTPEQRKFRKLVEQGVIKGKITKDEIILDQVTPELIELIESERHGLLFDWQDPIIFKKKKNSNE